MTQDHYLTAVAIYPHGHQWIAVVGEHQEEWICGIGESVNQALINLALNVDMQHRNWLEFAALCGNLGEAGPPSVNADGR